MTCLLACLLSVFMPGDATFVFADTDSTFGEALDIHAVILACRQAHMCMLDLCNVQLRPICIQVGAHNTTAEVLHDGNSNLNFVVLVCRHLALKLFCTAHQKPNATCPV